MASTGTVKFYLPDCVGFVERLDVFGSDLTVVNAARVSFHKESHELTLQDKRLLNFLAKHDHVSPFFHPQIRFRLKMPIFVAREWFRHTVGFARNEVSRRYVDSRAECWIPAASSIRERDPKLKQGSKATAVGNSYEVYSKIARATKAAVEMYEELLADGVAPEVARAILPQSMYTEFIETGSLFAYARLCALRLDPGAQVEIRRYAGLIDRALSVAFPAAWAALKVKFGGSAAAAAAAVAPAPAPAAPTVTTPVPTVQIPTTPLAAQPTAITPVTKPTPPSTEEHLPEICKPGTPLYQVSC
jgi:thymidylate synthase (FAD)